MAEQTSDGVYHGGGLYPQAQAERVFTADEVALLTDPGVCLPLGEPLYRPRRPSRFKLNPDSPLADAIGWF